MTRITEQERKWQPCFHVVFFLRNECMRWIDSMIYILYSLYSILKNESRPHFCRMLLHVITGESCDGGFLSSLTTGRLAAAFSLKQKQRSVGLFVGGLSWSRSWSRSKIETHRIGVCRLPLRQHVSSKRDGCQSVFDVALSSDSMAYPYSHLPAF
jgi:hypothetical protein